MKGEELEAYINDLVNIDDMVDSKEDNASMGSMVKYSMMLMMTPMKKTLVAT